MNFLTGKKSYIVAIAIIFYAVSGLILGKTDLNTAIMEILNGLGIAAIRKGISNG